MNDIEKKTFMTIDEAAEHQARLGGDLARIVKGIEDRAEEAASAFDKDGVSGVRAFMKRLASDLELAAGECLEKHLAKIGFDREPEQSKLN